MDVHEVVANNAKEVADETGEEVSEEVNASEKLGEKANEFMLERLVDIKFEWEDTWGVQSRS